MFQETITYTDFKGEEQTDTFYFHLSSSDIARIEISHQNRDHEGVMEYINQITKEQDGKKIIAFFEYFIAQSYGERSEDGRRFIKSEEALSRFRWSNAYDKFLLKMVTDAEFGAKFINGLMPEDLKAEADKLMQDQKATLKSVPVAPEPLSSEDFGHGLEVEDLGGTKEDSQQIKNAEDQVREILGKKPQQMNKRELLLAMRLKSAKGKVLTDQDVSDMDPFELELMIAAGAKLEGFED